MCVCLGVCGCLGVSSTMGVSGQEKHAQKRDHLGKSGCTYQVGEGAFVRLLHPCKSACQIKVGNTVTVEYAHFKSKR